MTLPQLPENVPSTSNSLSRFIGKLVLNLMGWRVIGNFPNEKKFIAAVAPHTSNWDFVIAVAVKLAVGLNVKFLGKDALFTNPLGYFMRAIGGIPVNRSSKQGLVEQMTQYFINADTLVLGIAPEGTRSKTLEWKKGFLYIAQSAQVPVVPVCLNFRTKLVEIKSPIDVCSSVDDTLVAIKQQFPADCAKYPQKV